MTEYRVRWQIVDTPHTYTSGVMETLEEAYEYRESIEIHTTRIWVEVARWEVFDGAGAARSDDEEVLLSAIDTVLGFVLPPNARAVLEGTLSRYGA